MPHGGSGTGLAQDATIQAMILLLGGTVPSGGSGTGLAQDASLQALYALLSGGVQPGASFAIRIPIALATVSSATAIPATAVVTRAYLDIQTPYSAGATIELGTAANPVLFMAAGDSNPQIAALYDALQDTASTSGDVMLVTIAGGPAAGAGFACVEYVIPLP